MAGFNDDVVRPPTFDISYWGDSVSDSSPVIPLAQSLPAGSARKYTTARAIEELMSIRARETLMPTRTIEQTMFAGTLDHTTPDADFDISKLKSTLFPEPPMSVTTSSDTMGQPLFTETAGRANTTDEPECKFELFPKLPIELQARIWKLTIPGPRVVRVKWTNEHRCFPPVPPLLHTCRASRDVAVSYYKQRNATGPSYIDFTSDTIFADVPSCNKWCAYSYMIRNFPDIRKAQSLAIELNMTMDISREILNLAALYMKDLKEISFIMGPCPAPKFNVVEEIRFVEYVPKDEEDEQARTELEAQMTKSFKKAFRSGGVVRVRDVEAC